MKDPRWKVQDQLSQYKGLVKLLGILKFII